MSAKMRTVGDIACSTIILRTLRGSTESLRRLDLPFIFVGTSWARTDDALEGHGQVFEFCWTTPLLATR